MLTSVGRTAAQRLVLTGAAPSKLPQLRTQWLAIRLAPTARGFAVSAWSRSPADKTASTKPKAAKKGDAATKEKTTKKKKTAVAAAKNKTKPTAEKPESEKLTPSKIEHLTPEERKKLLLKEYKKLNLKEPESLPSSAYRIFQTEFHAKNKGKFATITEAGQAHRDAWGNVPKYELDRLDSLAEENRKLNDEKYHEWLETQSPEAVYVANWVRSHLAKDFKLSPIKNHQFQDSRVTKRASAWGYFMVANKETFSAEQGLEEHSKRLSEKWKSMTEAEKKPFEDLVAASKEGTIPIAEMRARARTYWKQHSSLPPFITPTKFIGQEVKEESSEQ